MSVGYFARTLFSPSLNDSEGTQPTLAEDVNMTYIEEENFYGKGELEQMQLKEEDTMEVSTEILIMLFLMLISIMGGHMLKKKHHKYLQESGLTTLIGMIAGLLMWLLSVEDYMTRLSNHFVRLFMILLLPPIIFESGYNMKKKPFLANVGTIMMYAFIGTFIAIISSSILFYVCGLTELQPYFTIQESMAFGSLISATDPVAVLAIFKEMDADITIYTLIFGESIFNDAIAIVMYRTVEETSQPGTDYKAEIPASIALFFMILVGSVLIGALSALLIAFILKRQSSFHKEQREGQAARNSEQFQQKQMVNTEISMMLLCPWVAYLIAEGLELSGIVSILVNGIILSYYAEPNITIQSAKVLKAGYQAIAYAAETLVFIFLGMGLFAFNHPYQQMGVSMVILTILNLSFSRALNILFVSYFVNKTREETIITSKFQLVMWVSGLRGAMAYALALKCSIDFPIGPVILIDTLIYTFISIVIVASFLNPILDKCEVKRKDELPEVQQISNVHRRRCCGNLKDTMQRFDLHYFSPLFIKDQKDIDRRNRDQNTSEIDEGWVQDKNQDLIEKKTSEEDLH